jgi:hypothetical protein
MACTGLFVGYHPYTRAYQTYFQAQAPVMNAEAMESLVHGAAVPHYLPEGMEVASMCRESRIQDGRQQRWC